MTPIPRTENVIGLIQRCFREGWHETMCRPLLADALQEAGWPKDEPVLSKLRSPVNVTICPDYWVLVADEVPELLCTDGWASAFEFAGEVPPLPWWATTEDEPWRPTNESNVITAHPGDKLTPTDPFARRDVAEVVACDPGENDVKNWLCFGRLKDKRWFFLDAGCDYTGWDCRAWGTVNVGPSEYIVKKFAMVAEQRHRLGIAFKNDPTPIPFDKDADYDKD